MEVAKRLMLENRAWATEVLSRDPERFKRLAVRQAPDVLWIGCSDSRVPAELITNAEPGDLFVHRNIANLVCEDDPNLMSVLQYALEVLRVGNVIVCGHQGCGGVRASLARVPELPHVDARLDEIRQVYRAHCAELDRLDGDDARTARLVELNAIAQVRKLAEMPLVRNVWDSGRALRLHAWIYSLETGLLEERLCLDGTEAAADLEPLAA
ncbi:carbonic anhydrase [Cupriavidus gilardii CR3]|uniref:Carbonic anhydrase n=1 Tax=Cupriavidus gilardii TaxID=82541 RepID=A0A849B5V4_9BURK|nr:carbonic anhydrase [Cupriavidus gilardii]ALD89910.1 carbonic anhydrase [Cupriavidus gilardii CR3]KAB0598717.1 carbonic anhydrase [Cupriavidus gilardii]MCT9015225.1 carbonic anhydrase [Cupriavidus gilardii]MCT9054995.1 carbonic anhydrase [Cupriavidus gilardii]MCT9125531.1 carbonic anhydrase [Cupriavidus gilardii]